MSKNYEKIIDKLCKDDSFGILTRNGIDYKSKETNYRWIVLMDFCNISKMNAKYGYEEVNNKFKILFAFEQKENMIGRCFSGDEIIILTNNVRISEKLKNPAKNIGLSFRSHIIEFSGNINNDLKEMYKYI